MDRSKLSFQCPELTPSRLTGLRFNSPTSGYGYNYRYLGPGLAIDWAFNGTNWVPTVDPTKPISYRFADVVQLTHTIAFADSAQVECLNWPVCDRLGFRENWHLEPPSGQFPTVHFRHHDMAVVGFLDGHVETMRRSWIDLPFVPPPQAEFMAEKRLGFVGEDDTLWDRN
jgi:prepilin-type processing-associated H-X9-DG protein